MYKKHAAFITLVSLVFGMALLCTEGIHVTKNSSCEAFVIHNQETEKVLEATSYLGITRDRISDQRVLDLNILKKNTRYQLTQQEYEDLLRIVEAEAGGEDRKGKILVANVILNRVRHEAFPDTVSEVIFQSENGVAQFSPISDGRFYTVVVSEDTKRAVNAALMGEDNSQGALYFVARSAAGEKSMRWFDQNLTRLFAHGGHEFFS